MFSIITPFIEQLLRKVNIIKHFSQSHLMIIHSCMLFFDRKQVCLMLLLPFYSSPSGHSSLSLFTFPKKLHFVTSLNFFPPFTFTKKPPSRHLPMHKASSPATPFNLLISSLYMTETNFFVKIKIEILIK